MADTEILKRAEKYIKGKGQTLNKYDLVGFANAETELLSKHILELQTTNGALTDRVNEATEIIESLRTCLLDFDEDTIEPYKQYIDKAEAFLRSKKNDSKNEDNIG